MLQSLIIATTIRAKMELLAQVLHQQAFAVAKTITPGSTAKVSINITMHILYLYTLFVFIVSYQFSVNIV